MLDHDDKITKDKNQFFNEYLSKYPLAPIHYIIDLGSNQYMKAIIISVQVQYIDFNAIGYPLKVITDKLTTIEALTEQQFIHFLYSKTQSLTEETRQIKIKELVKSLDEKWVKDRRKYEKSKEKESAKDPNKNVHPSQEEHASDDDVVTQMQTEIQQTTTTNIENQSINIENELSDIQVIDCIDPSEEQRKNIFMGINTKIVAEPNLNLSRPFLTQLKQLNQVEDNYVFDHLIPPEEKIEETSELEAKFEYTDMDVWNSGNWTMLKYVGDNGKIARKFMSRSTAEKVRAVAVESFQRTNLQTQLWTRDNAAEFEKYEKYKEDTTKKVIVIDQDELFYKSISKKEKQIKEFEEKKQAMDEDEEDDEDEDEDEAEAEDEDEDEAEEQEEDDDDDDEDVDINKNKNLKKKKKKKTKSKSNEINIVFDNTLATCVTTDKGMISVCIVFTNFLINEKIYLQRAHKVFHICFVGLKKYIQKLKHYICMQQISL